MSMIGINLSSQANNETRIEAFQADKTRVMKQSDFDAFKEKMARLSNDRVESAQAKLVGAEGTPDSETIRELLQSKKLAARAAMTAAEAHKVNTFLCAMVRDSRF